MSANPYESPRVADAQARFDPHRLTLFAATMYVLLTGAGGCLLGGLLGALLGLLAPDYYRSVFPGLDGPTFNPVAMGLVLGATQGLGGGLVVGFIILLAYIWYLTRAKAA